MTRALLPRLSPATLAVATLGVLAATVGCLGADEAPAAMAPMPAEAEMAVADDGDFGGGGNFKEADKVGGKREMKKRAAKGKPSPKPSRARAPGALPADMPVAALEEAEPEEPQPDAAPTVRSWFPETLLFEPSVVTDAQGRAQVPVVVPDRLTTWRVLALAHSREGAQAGAVATFDSRMDAYVDAVAPPFLIKGDVAQLPVQVVNTTDEELKTSLTLGAVGGAVDTRPQKLTVPARGSKTVFAKLETERAGTVVLSATLEGLDAVERPITVDPTGRPASTSWSGTLASERSKSITLPDLAQPDSVEARLTVYPGALAVLRAELGTARARSSLHDDAYLLLLAGRAPELGKSLGSQPEADALRKLRLIGTQRVIRHARSPAPGVAAVLASSALAHAEDPLLSRLGERLASQVARSQRPDGTFGGADGWPLQRLLVSTADGLRAVQAAARDERQQRRAQAAALRAAGAFRRHLKRVEDGYTAAAALASGGVEGKLAEQLVERVMKSIKTGGDGTRYLHVAKGVVAGDGARPTQVEATALAILALDGRDAAKAVLPDLGAYLLARYGPGGFGSGRANLLALEAVARVFKAPLPAQVTVRLFLDDAELATAQLSGDKLREVVGVTARAPDAVGAHKWRVVAEPALPGLGFALTTSWREPFGEPGEGGLELAVERADGAKVGRPLAVTLRATAPGGAALRVRHGLPAGCQPDLPSLDKLTSDGVISRYETEDGAVVLYAPSRRQGQAFVARYRVIPTLAGTLRGRPSEIALDGRGRSGAVGLAGEVWRISR
jgi:hypothetical protein